MLDIDELAFVRSRLDFYPKLSDTEIKSLEAAVSISAYGEGDTLRSKETECMGLLLVKSGSLRVYILSEDGREVTLYRLGPGEICALSASCVLNSITFDVHIEAEEPSEVFKIGIAVIDKLMKSNVYAENFVCKSALERFSDVMWAMEQLLFMRFDKRLAAFLLDESSKSDSREIGLSHEQIAKYLGSAREVVSRMLKTFQSQGLVEQSRLCVRVIDRDGLKALL